MTFSDSSWWQKNRLLLIVSSIIILFAALVVVVFFGYQYRWSWTGLTPSVGPNVQQYQPISPTKTLWDWLQMLVVPIFLVATAFLFNIASSHNQSEIEKKRNDTERAIAKEGLQEDLLQSYLDCLSDLLLSKNLKTSEQHTEVRDIARARTLVVLSRLDGERKGILIGFLHESGLISADKTGSIIDLEHADLTQANLVRANLTGARLSKANLSGADLTEARLSTADLTGADLTSADLTGAELSDTDLTSAMLAKTILKGAHLVKARLHQAKLINADLRNANLTSAKLTEADLRNADLSMAVLRKAILLGAKIAGARFDQVDDEGAVYSDEQKELIQNSL